MNYIIGMCKRHKDWICLLNDLGYEPQIIEQQIRTSTDEVVKPDVIVTSNRLIHSLVFECKGGTTIDTDQLRRYSTLAVDNLLRWVTTFTSTDFHFDVCISDLQENHLFLATISKHFPMITFGKHKLFRTGEFKEGTLNDAFSKPIDLVGKIPPLSYYPFSEDDVNTYIAPFVIRGLVSVAVKKAKGGPSALEESLVTRDELLRLIFNPVFDALSKQHQGRLRGKIREVVRWVLAREEMEEALGVIESRAGMTIRQPLEKLVREAQRLIEQLETQKPLIDFMPKS